MKNHTTDSATEGGAFVSLREGLSIQIERRRTRPSLLFADIGILLLGLVFARCHIVFGARPLAVGLLALLPQGVFIALVGAVTGALTLGGAGSVYAIIYVLLVALRIIISGAVGEGRVFGERLPLRICEATIGGFLAAAYQVLLTGISVSSVLFGLAMTLTPPLATFAISGIFDTGIGFSDFFKGDAELLSTKERGERERYSLIFFQCSAALLSLLFSLSLSEFDILGFSLSYVYVSAATLFTARRFGAIRAAAIGFISALPVSASYSVSFALAGLASGALFAIGATWGIGGAAVAVLVWSAYVGGGVGVLTVLPELAVGAALAAPLVRKPLATEKKPEPRDPSEDAGEMVGTMSLAYKSRSDGSLDALEAALTAISAAARSFDSEERVREDEYRALVEATCEGYDAFGGDRVKRLCAERSSVIARRLARGEGFTASMLGVIGEEELFAEELSALISARAARLEEERYKQSMTSASYEDYALISRLISEARRREASEKCLDAELSDSLTEVFAKNGFPSGVIKAFGNRRRHIIAAGRDPDGNMITSPALRADIESLADVRLGEAEYFRRGESVLLEVDTSRRLSAEWASATIAGSSGEVSGDLAVSFESQDDYFYSLISDGMGSGELARETAEFVSKFLTHALDGGGFSDTVLHVLNHIIRRRGEECSATVDLFELDLIRGDAVFIKSGAAPSFVKRDSSIFRIRSETAPIGLMRSVDAERMRVEVKDGDLIVMLSDGVSSSPEDAPWLLELLAEPPKRSVKEYAEYILSAAVKNSSSGDDMTVTVTRIKSI